MYSISPSGGKVIVGACVVCAFVLPIASSEASIAREPARVPPDDAPVRIEEEAEALGVNATRAKFPRAFMASAGIESVEGTWMSQGPGPTRLGQVENVSPNNEVVGAIHTVAAHPTDANILYAGAVNGGVWKTTNATAASPNWSPLTDDQASLSIGALEFDPTDGTSNTLWAGIGRFSSFFRGGTRTGLLSTIDGGTTWTPINGGGTLVDKNISGVAVRGNTVVVSMNDATSFFADIGIYRSVDGGASFSQLNLTTDGMPRGVCFDLASDPTSTSNLYTAVVFTDISEGPADVDGIYKSADTGATWTKVSSAEMDALLQGGTTSNVEIAVGNSGQVYVAILNSGQLRNGGVFRSPNGNAGTWVAMDVPLVNEGGGTEGTNPRFKREAGVPAGQGSIHFSIRADPGNANVVYVGGDRQPFPSALGAFDFSGRLFRGDASQTPTGGAPSPQWDHLTHTAGAGGMPWGGTANGSAPHADSREMVFDANGNLIEVDDGGDIPAHESAEQHGGLVLDQREHSNVRTALGRLRHAVEHHLLRESGHGHDPAECGGFDHVGQRIDRRWGRRGGIAGPRQSKPFHSLFEYTISRLFWKLWRSV